MRRAYFPLFLLTALVALQVFFSYRNSNMLSFPLDDAFIHMAISKNIVEHGVWGITRFEFSSTSSSILYTLLLSFAFLVGGVHTWIPILVNWLAAAWLLVLLARWSKDFMDFKTSQAFLGLFVLLVPLAGMAVLGMEHTLQILLCCLFFYLTWKGWSGEGRLHPVYYIIAFLAVLTRYESAFLVGLAAAGWLFLYRRPAIFFLLLLAAVLPVAGFGIYAVSQGGMFFPNSLLAKSNFLGGGAWSYISALAAKFLSTGMLYALLAIPFIYWILFPFRNENQKIPSPGHNIMLLMALTAFFHLVLASYGWLFRYEAYLVALLFLAVLLTWPDWKEKFSATKRSSGIVILVFSVILLFPILSRIQMISHTKRAAKNIADQQVQMARFVGSYFPHYGVAMNDIGAMCFYNDDMRLFDMEGLGTLDVIKMKKNFDSTFLLQQVEKRAVKIGIFYPHLYQGKIPSVWKQVGTWELLDNFVTAGSIVGFYAIDPAEEEKMRKALLDFAPSLPSNVIQKINP